MNVTSALPEFRPLITLIVIGANIEDVSEIADPPLGAAEFRVTVAVTVCPMVKFGPPLRATDEIDGADRTFTATDAQAEFPQPFS